MRGNNSQPKEQPNREGATAFDFRGTVVCIAGASKGIGKELATAFAARGAALALLARSPQLDEVHEKLARQTDVVSLKCDISDYQAVADAAATIGKRWKKIDVLINTAAVLGATGPVWTTDPIAWSSAISANLVGTYHTIRAFLPPMIEARKGKIINFAGGGAAYGYPAFSSYAASKVAVVRLTETVAMECAAYNVQANVVAPGAIETDLLQQVREAGGEVRTLGSMQQVVELVSFLASGESDHISGRFIHAKDSYKDWRDLDSDLYTLRRVQA